jgi:hypothetical protein
MDSDTTENGRKILAIFGHFDSKAGEVLQANNFVSIGERHRWDMRDLQEGLTFAARQGWIEETSQGGWKLTPNGFREMAARTEKA